jgi:hypothetical protein
MCCAVFNLQADEAKFADIVIFSFNRPLQLYALLESLERYCTGINQLHVIYRTSNEQFDQGYQLVMDDFPAIYYHKQGSDQKQDFKQLTLKAAFESTSDYLLFAVDDIIVKKELDLSACINALEQYNAYAFFLRLGTHLTNCYPYGSRAQPLPPLQYGENDIVIWQFSQGSFDWSYPHNVDMTLYRKKDIENDLNSCSYDMPNKLEAVWHRKASAIVHKKGLCYTIAPVVNIPLNRVQNDFQNRAMKEWSPQDLLQEFLAGKKMDVEPIYGVLNTAAHMEYSPTFIAR